MKVLVAIASSTERKRLGSLLATQAHDVHEAADLAGVHKVASCDDLDVVLVDWAMCQGTCEAVTTATQPPFVIVVQPQWTSKDIASAYATGAHDFLRVSAYDAEVLGRVNGFKRMQSWLRAGRRDCPADFDLSQVPAWRGLEALLTEEIGALIGTPLRRSQKEGYAVAHASQIPLVLATEHVEVRLSIGADAAACAVLADKLLGGDTSAAAIADALREMANTIGGALKRAAFADGTCFTLGLPSDGSLFSDPAAKLRWHAETEEGLCLAFAAKVIMTAPRRLPVSGLREGMVLVRDLKNAAGVLLASAGTLLTRSAAERLGSLAGANVVIEVSGTTHA